MQLKQTLLALSTGLALASLSMGSMACTTLIVGKNVSETGRVMVGHTEDAGGRVLHQEFFYPAQKHAEGADPLVAEPGRAVIPNVPETLDTYWSNMLDMAGSSFDQGFTNGAGLIICSNGGGSSYDGNELSDADAKLVDGGIGFLFRRTIAERAHNAREAVKIAGEIIEKYGYFGAARNYTVADKDEAWIINVVKGRHYVAKRIPDDKVMLISNYLAIRDVDLNDKENVIASPDLIEYAIKMGRYKPAKAGDYSDFDFSRAYQPDDSSRLRSTNALRLQTGWEYLTGIHYSDWLHFPELQSPKFKVGVDEIRHLMRLTAPKTYAERGDGRADAFHVSADDISRSQTRESWVMELGEKPHLNTLWRCSSYQETGPYIPWFPTAGKIPEGYQWTSLEEARKVHFNMKPEYLSLDWNKSYFTYAVLGELVNFNRGLLGGVLPVQADVEKVFDAEVAKVREQVKDLPRDEARKILADFTVASAAKADKIYKDLLVSINTVKATADRKDVSVADKDGTITFTMTKTADMPFNTWDKATLYWSLGITGAKASTLDPVTPVSVKETKDSIAFTFKTADVAKYAVAGCLTDTYLRGYADHKRFVAMVPVMFTK